MSIPVLAYDYQSQTLIQLGFLRLPKFFAKFVPNLMLSLHFANHHIHVRPPVGIRN